MRPSSHFLGLILLLVGTNSAVRADSVLREVGPLPYVLNTAKAGKPTSKVSYKFDEREFAQTGINIRADGSISVDTRFENGKSIEGAHFYCRIELLDGEQKIIAAARQEAAMKAGGEKTIAAKTKLAPQLVARVKQVRLTYGHFDNTGDENFWQQVRASAQGAPVSNGDFTVLMP